MRRTLRTRCLGPPRSRSSRPIWNRSGQGHCLCRGSSAGPCALHHPCLCRWSLGLSDGTPTSRARPAPLRLPAGRGTPPARPLASCPLPRGSRKRLRIYHTPASRRNECPCGGHPVTAALAGRPSSCGRSRHPERGCAVKKKSAPGRFSQGYELAEEEGFEPSLPGLRVKRFSRPPHSTTLPPLRIRDEAATVFADGHGRSRRLVQRFDHAAFCKPASHSVFMAERRGFEPRIRFWRIHDFQSCSFGQLGHLSASPSCAPSSDEAAAK